MQELAVVGSGYVGTVVAAAMAHIGRRVVALESNPEKLVALQAGTVPFYEPGLSELVTEGISAGLLRFTKDPADAFADAKTIFLCVGTPGNGSGEPDLSALEAAASTVATDARPDAVLVIKSTVPVGTGTRLGALVGDGQRVVSNPEFLREGHAVTDFLYPERIVLGSNDDEARRRVIEVYRPILEQSFDGSGGRHPELVEADHASAELIKYSANTFLATKVSFINEIASICEITGADVDTVALGIGLDSRVGYSFLNAGAGWGGSCFGKDLDALRHLATKHGLEARILDAAAEVNERQRDIVVSRLKDHLGTLEGKRVGLLGLAFKPNTDNLRDSPAIAIAQRLLAAGAVVTAYDPVVKDAGDARLVTCPDPYEAGTGADAVVLATDWSEFYDIDLAEMERVMRGSIFFDARGMLDSKAAAAAGLTYDAFGHTRDTEPRA